MAHDPYDRPCGGGARILPDLLRDELREETKKVFGSSAVIAGVSDGYLFLSAKGRALDGKARSQIEQVLRRVLKEKHAGQVEAVYDVKELAEKCPAALASPAAKPIPDRARAGAEDIFTLVCRSWAPNGGAGDFYIVPAHGSYFDGEIVPGKGGSHGAPWLYDRTVPLLVRGPGIGAGVTFDDPVDFTAYSAIEAAFIGVTSDDAGKVLDAARAR